MEIPRGAAGQKGTWYIEGEKGEHIAYCVCMDCPKCGKGCSIYWEVGGKASRDSHTILADGTVQPSSVCPFPPCDFHEWIKLLDYDLGELRKGSTDV